MLEERTEQEYVAVVSRVLDYIQLRLDREITPRELAEVAGYSAHHFHRVFRAVVGESVMDHVRRLRLERAALQLRKTREPIGQVAIDAGFCAQEAFTRSFQIHFGVSPRAYRTCALAHTLPSPNGIHFDGGAMAPPRFMRATEPGLLFELWLCPAHRHYADVFEQRWEQFLSWATGAASIIYPSEQFRPEGWEENHMSTTTTIDNELDELQKEVETAKLRLSEARKKRPLEEVQDYTLQDSSGKPVKLSEMFGDKEDLILIHNMGTGCVYCTMWADGFTGLVPHLSDRASFVLISPDKPEVQKRFAEKRHWNFRMYSTHESTFNSDMGFQGADGPWPGVSTFKKSDGKIYRVAKAQFGPGDDFCVTWPFLDMLEEGQKGWEPQYSYGEKP